jgi:hypothetical protein
MNVAPISVPLSFDVTFDEPGLPVAMTVYSLSGTPTLVQGPTAMVNVSDNTYVGSFSSSLPGVAFLIIKAVYTDNTFATLSPNYSQGSETIVMQNLGGGSLSPSNNLVIGFVNSKCFEIFLSDDRTQSLKALYDCTFLPVDLTSCTEINVQLPLALGGFTQLLLSAGQVAISSPAVLGEYAVSIPPSVSELLNVGALQDFYVTFTISGKPFTLRYFQGVSIFEI